MRQDELACNEESCFAGFSACGGPRKRHLPFCLSAIQSRAFFLNVKQSFLLKKTAQAAHKLQENLKFPLLCLAQAVDARQMPYSLVVPYFRQSYSLL